MNCLSKIIKGGGNENQIGVNDMKKLHHLLKALSVLGVQLLFVGVVYATDMSEAQTINRTRELIKASGATGLLEHIEKCQKEDARSCFVLGAAFIFSKGVKKNAVIGIYWETKAAELGYSDAQYNLSIEYRDGGAVEKNVERGIYWERIAAENDHPVAMFNLAIAACDGRRAGVTCKDGIRYLQRSAQRGYVPAKTSLGLVYLKGRDVEQNFEKGRAYLEEAMRLGDPDAFCWAGYMHSRGIGVKTDRNKGDELVLKAAAMGSTVCSVFKQ